MNDQAKLLLSAYRPGGADAGDPAFAETLAFAERDPQLRAWFQESQLFDQAVAGKLRDLPIPQNLRATILAGAKFSQPRHWWQNPRLLALAATLLIVGAALAIWMGKSAPLDRWQTDSLAVLDGIIGGTGSFDLVDSQPGKLVDWLSKRALPAPSSLPQSLSAHASLGCKTIVSDGRTISLICFNLGGGQAAHLFTTPHAGLKIDSPENHPIFSHRGHWNLASWRQGEQVHMLASQVDEAQMRAMIAMVAGTFRER